MTVSHVHVVVGTFDDEKHANAIAKTKGSVTLVGTLELVDAAAILRHLDGRIQLDVIEDANEEVRPHRSALAGGFVGLIFPPDTLAPAVGDFAAGLPNDPHLSADDEGLSDNLVAQMQRLAVLRDRDAMTEDDYQRQRVLLTMAARERRATPT